MEKNEEIKQAAIQYANENNILDGYKLNQFIAGAKWANNNLIDKIQQILKTNTFLTDDEIKDLLSLITKNEKYLIVYHSKDADGWLSKFLLSKYLESKNINKFECFGYNYEPNKLSNIQKEYNTILFGDICPTLEWLKQYREKYPNTKIYIFDHHKSIVDKIKSEYFQNVFIITNLEEEKFSGSGLIRQYLIDKCELSELLNNKGFRKVIQYVNDYDTWQFEQNLDNPNETILFSEYVKNLIPNEIYFDNLCQQIIYDNSNLENILINGKLFYNKTLLNQKNNVISDMYFNDTFGIRFIFLNAYPEWCTEQLIYNLLSLKPEEKIVWCYREIDFTNKTIKLSFRSNKATTIEACAKTYAERLGGGGHKNAAGVNIPLNNENIMFLLKPENIVNIL